jgi:hypothetical protein
MTEAEVVELLNMQAANAMNGFVIYNTFTFGYLTVAYLVGKNLSKFQAITISSFFVIAASAFAIVTVTHCQSVEFLVTNYPEFAYTIFWRTPWSLLIGGIEVGGIFVSLYFMYDTRKARDT